MRKVWAQNPQLYEGFKFTHHPSQNLDLLAVAQNKEGSPPVLPEAIIKIKQNMFCNSKTWQVLEKKAFSAMALEDTFSKKKKSPGYYQVKHSGNNPAANQIKEKQV